MKSIEIKIKKPTKEELENIIKPLIPEPKNGEDGKTPKKGVEYFTEKEQKQFVKDVLSLIEIPKVDYKKVKDFVKEEVAKIPKPFAQIKEKPVDVNSIIATVLSRIPKHDISKEVNDAVKALNLEEIMAHSGRFNSPGVRMRLGDTSDVDLEGLQVNQVLKWNGSAWVPTNMSGGGGAVDSVNGQTGVVVLDADDIDDTSTTHKFTTSSDISKLAGIEAGAEVNNISDANATDLTDGGDTTLHTHDDRYYTESETDILLGNKLDTSLKGVNNGLAELDSGGLVPSSQLPSYVDDVLEYADFASLPVTGATGKIYITLDNNLTYRWSGSAYVEISASLALGETSSTAYRGDRGKTAYDHSQLTSGNPHNVTKSDVGLGSVDNVSASSLRDRSTHTGTQTASTISDFQTTVSANSDVSANTSARHSALTVTDSTEIDFTLTGQDLTASLKAGSIDETKLDASTNASLDLADSSLQPANISDTAYDDTSWNGVTTIAPSKNAVRDKINTMDSTIAGKQDALGYTAENSANKENTTIDTNTTKYPTVNLLKTGLDTKQATLVSGTNIKTVNSTSLLGSGDIAITPNATHTGEVTGATTLTVDKTTITNKVDTTIIASDMLLFSDASDSDNLKKGQVQDIIDLAVGNVSADTIWDAKGDLAVGTGTDTAQKLTVGLNGQMVVADSSETVGLKYINRPITATGGASTYFVKESGKYYKVHRFTSNGYFTIADGSGEVEVAVVGGGGAGAYGWGGGGAGGDVEVDSVTVADGDVISVVIGAATAKTVSGDGANGNQSSFGSVVALGGEGGKTSSGRGGHNSDYTGGNGGSSSGGGGAGSGQNGANAVSTSGGAGGNGEETTVGTTKRYAGGGGGCGLTGYGAGKDGGGNAGDSGVDASANTGSGGGGAGIGGNTGGAGASGLVIVRYEVPIPTTSQVIQKRISIFTPSGAQQLTTTHTDIDGSSMNFTPISATSIIKYTYSFFVTSDSTSENPFMHCKLMFDGVENAMSRRNLFINTNSSELYFTYSFAIDSWGRSEKTLKMQGREYSSTFDVRLFQNKYWDGATTTVLNNAILEIEEIE